MATLIKLNKTQLRAEQSRLLELNKYLPVLQLKKERLQKEVSVAKELIEESLKRFEEEKAKIKAFTPLFKAKQAFELFRLIEIESVETSQDNIAGVEFPVLEKVHFKESSYSLFATPVWLDSASVLLQRVLIAKEEVYFAEEKKRCLEQELQEVSIRVNLFEKILIPRAQQNIRKIKIFLGDQQLGAIAQAKFAKMKIEAKEEMAKEG